MALGREGAPVAVGSWVLTDLYHTIPYHTIPYKNVVTILGPKEDGSYRPGSTFMDAPPHASMDDLCALANDKRG